MGFYKLETESSDYSLGKLIKAVHETIDYERHFECWLENSPDILFEEDTNTVLWIGRQESVGVGNVKKFPDLIGIDRSGDLIIVELKKGKTPRQVVAQILEYASWAVDLAKEDLERIYRNYVSNTESDVSQISLDDEYNRIFNSENEYVVPVYNKYQKLFIVAEEISPIIIQVVNYLRTKELNIYCLEYIVHKTENNDIFIKTVQKVWEKQSPIEKEQHNGIKRWNEDIKVKDVVYEAVCTFTKNKKDVIFTPAEIYDLILKDYPAFNRSTLNCQLIADSVNLKWTPMSRHILRKTCLIKPLFYMPCQV